MPNCIITGQKGPFGPNIQLAENTSLKAWIYKNSHSPSNFLDFALKLAWRWAVVAVRAWLKLSLARVISLVSMSGVQHVTPRGQIFRWIPETEKQEWGVGIIFREAGVRDVITIYPSLHFELPNPVLGEWSEWMKVTLETDIILANLKLNWWRPMIREKFYWQFIKRLLLDQRDDVQ